MTSNDVKNKPEWRPSTCEECGTVFGMSAGPVEYKKYLVYYGTSFIHLCQGRTQISSKEVKL